MAEPCQKCAKDLNTWTIEEGIEFRRLPHWLERGYAEPLPRGPYCWTCWKDIMQKEPKPQ